MGAGCLGRIGGVEANAYQGDVVPELRLCAHRLVQLGGWSGVLEMGQ